MELASLALLCKALPSALPALLCDLDDLATPASLEEGEGAEGREMPWTLPDRERSRHRVDGGPARRSGRSHRLAAEKRLTKAQGITPGQWRHVRAAPVAHSGQGCWILRAALGLGTPSLAGDCSTR